MNLLNELASSKKIQVIDFRGEERMKNNVYESKLILPNFLADRYGRLNLQDLISVFIALSTEQTEQMDVPDVGELGYKWIITQYKLEINRMPKISEEVTIRTFIKEHNRVFTYREFELYDENNELLVHVLTVFALINEKRKLSRIPKELTEAFGSKESKRIRRLARPDLPDLKNQVKEKTYSVRYFDIDRNFHANNSMYFIWMLDALGDEFLARHDILSGNVVYEKEIYMDEEVVSYVDFKIDEQENLISRHQIKVDEISRAHANFTWTTNEVDYEADLKSLNNNK